jgi:hypothetical protein
MYAPLYIRQDATVKNGKIPLKSGRLDAAG